MSSDDKQSGDTLSPSSPERVEVLKARIARAMWLINYYENNEKKDDEGVDSL